MQADLKGEPKADETGKLWTPGAVDFFRIVNEQLQVTSTVSNGNLLLRSGQASLRVMRQFQVELHLFFFRLLELASAGVYKHKICVVFAITRRMIGKS